MALSSTSSVSANQINTELGYSPTASMSIYAVLNTVGKGGSPASYNEIRGYDVDNWEIDPDQWNYGWLTPVGNKGSCDTGYLYFTVYLYNRCPSDSASGTVYWHISTSSSYDSNSDSGSYYYAASQYPGYDVESNIYASGPQISCNTYLWLSFDDSTYVYVPWS